MSSAEKGEEDTGIGGRWQSLLYPQQGWAGAELPGPTSFREPPHLLRNGLSKQEALERVQFL